jgi:trk system potassium uptake protein TrkA
MPQSTHRHQATVPEPSEVSMHAVVVGCGRVGASVAAALEAGGHTVAVIDKDAGAFRRLPSGFGGRRVKGFGFDRDRLVEAGIEDASALAAVTNGDNSNIVVARVARETFGIERVVARIYDPRRARIYERLGIPTIATVHWSTERVLRRILPEQSAVEWVDPSASVCLLERMLPAAWASHTVSELEAAGAVRVVALSRLGVAELPRPESVLQDGDALWLAVADDQLASLDALLAAPGGAK